MKIYFKALLTLFLSKNSIVHSSIGLGILLLGFHFPIFSQGQLKIDAENQHITVFLNRAQIDARVKTNVQAGTTKLIISNVATTADPNSIQIGGKGDVMIMSVKFKQNYLGNKRRSTLEDSLKLAKSELEVVDVLVKVAENERNMLMANANVKSEKDGATPEDLKEMMDFFRTKLTEIGTRQMQLLRQSKDLQDKINRFQQQLTSQGTNINQPAGEIELTLQAKSATAIELNLSYIANNVGWSPIYDIRAKDVKSNIELAYRANVYQNTGIDWKNVRLSLSTANPAEGGAKPELYAQYLNINEPVETPKRNVRMSKGVMPVEMAMSAAPQAMDEVITVASVVNTVQSTLAVNFDIAIPYNIASGGNPEMVDIQNHSLRSTYKYYTVPKFDKDAFLTAIITDWEKYNLLPGVANVYFEGTFVGTTEIAGGEAKDSLMISLGRDKKIIAKRETVEEFKSRKNVGSNIRESFGARITLRNTKTEAINIVVEDQVPVSQDSRIEIELEEAKGAEFNKETGKLTWNLTLQPLENKEIILKYSVKYPKGKNIQGL
ncbi:Conserved hypothetical protein CHP02231 [Emticicia oligotrophica DSM 17448]|uniref:Mucoidy inhibitor MuiA family protein n=1 Tax=Emticicia oligotrophica (strain DSM 17448 / CIP 109782 / MTCC 6937 / GPTSA100-15) TaxID=929562 RepID=A0ABN4ABQ9_EMTOG|nr:DUF4139 domain-containing protein [Emticicia oligotrophica]AFK01594.1 Conserved hypothetical protein CHP02231 [Emticicia oligotrophica DSM 17448]